MNILTIDNGNSNPHIGVFKNQEIQQIIPLKEFRNCHTLYGAEDFYSVYSNVGPFFEDSQNLLKRKLPVLDLWQDDMFLDMPVSYARTLGEDRLFQAYYLYQKYIKTNKSKSLLLIDAGTFITLDIVSEKGFLGGFIVPGLKQLISSPAKGHLLSNIKVSEVVRSMSIQLPHATADALGGGVKLIVSGMLQKMITLFSFDLCVITGGDASNLLSFVTQEYEEKVGLKFFPNLIHHSLAMIGERYLISKEELP